MILPYREMFAKFLSFLNEIGFTDIQINIYKYLLKNRYGTINDIKNELNYSYTQVYHNLLFLEENQLIESSSESKPKLFIRINPKIALTELLNNRYNNYRDNIENIDKEIKIQESKSGHCVRDVSFYHYSDNILAIENFHHLFEITQKEIIMSSLPPILLRRLEPSLYNAFLRGVKLKMYFSQLDYEEYPNYFEEITDVLKRVRVELIQTKEKTCQLIRFNDNIVNMGNILIDEFYLNSVIFNGNETYHIDGFKGPFAKQAKKMLEIKTVIKKMEIEYPKPIQNVLKIIEEFKSIKTRDLSSKSKIGGAKLREILEFLANSGVIEETLIKGNKAGRPKRMYSISDDV